MNIDDWIRPQIRKMSAYHIPDVTNVVKLDAMENPYNLPEELVSQWLDSLRSASLNRYPDPHATILKESIRDTLHTPQEMSLLLGNGSDEIIQLVLMAVAEPGRTVLSPEPSFVMYQVIAQALGMNYRGVPLNDEFALDLRAMLEAIEETNPAVVFLAYPNNPTGNLFDRNAIIEIIQACNGLVVVDEAYFAFTDNTFMDSLNKYPNMLVMRTLSKMGLAGLRLGYLSGHPDWLNEFEKIRLPYNINVLSQVSARFALQNIAIFNQQSQKIIKYRGLVSLALNSFENLQVFHSDANFILFKLIQGDANTVYNSLLKKGILIKNLSASKNPALQNCLRVTVGSRQENDAFLSALHTECG